MRGIALALALGCCAGVAPAQSAGTDSPTRDRMQRQLELEQRNNFENLLRRSQEAAPLTEPERAVQSVVDAITQGDCPGAVARLNAGLARAFPEVFGLAGAMYEEGLCLKPNWDRALAFYQRAAGAGQPGFTARIAAGYAAPIGGRDLATALWWALRAKTALPEPCARVAPLVDDADKFVAALNAWPAGQLGACAYAAAVMATIQAEAEAIRLGPASGLEGRYKVRLRAAQGEVDLVDELAAAGGADAARARRTIEAKQAVAAHLRQVADRALKRYDRPGAIASDWRPEAVFEFKGAR